MRQYLKYSVLIFIDCISLVYADEVLEDIFGDEEWVSISTGTKKAIHKAPAVTNVITAEDIKLMGAATLDEILETVPGMHVGFALPPSLSTYIIRGFGGAFNSQLLTLINGVAVDTALNGGRPNAFRMPVSNIERIEIIRGPGSAVYGADAYAGVIDIITKDAASMSGTEFGVRVGSFGMRESWFQHGGDLMGDWGIYFGLDYQTTDGDDDRIIQSDLQSQLDSLFGSAASLAPGSLNTEYTVSDVRMDLSNEHWKVRLSHLDIGDAGLGAGIAQALDNTGKINSSVFTVDVTYNDEEMVDNWLLEFKVAYTHLEGEPDFQILPPGATVPIGEDGNLFTEASSACPAIGPNATPLCIVSFPDGFLGNPYMEEKHYRFETVGIYDVYDKHRVRVSVGFQQQDLDASSTQNFGPGVIDGTISPINGGLIDVTGTDNIYIKDGAQSRNIKFVSLQDEWLISNDWELTAGIRYDNYSDFGDTVNPRLALVWQSSYNSTTKFLYGRAFRAPSFSDQFSQNNPIALGNNMLGPETIDLIELVLNYRPTLDSQISLNTFFYDAEDLIQFVRDVSGATSTAQNTEGQTGSGVELEYDHRINETIKLYANFSWLKAENDITNEDIVDIPMQQFFLNVSWSFMNQWFLVGSSKWIADRKRLRKNPNDISSIADTRDEISDYIIFDFLVRTEGFIEGLDFSVSIKNAFDKKAYDPSPAPSVAVPGDFPLQGRSFFVETRFLL